MSWHHKSILLSLTKKLIRHDKSNYIWKVCVETVIYHRSLVHTHSPQSPLIKGAKQTQMAMESFDDSNFTIKQFAINSLNAERYSPVSRWSNLQYFTAFIRWKNESILIFIIYGIDTQFSQAFPGNFQKNLKKTRNVDEFIQWRKLYWRDLKKE